MPYVKENLNHYVKHREPFRPFAISVPEEECARYFDCSPLACFMSALGRVLPEGRELVKDFVLPGDRIRLCPVSWTRAPLLWQLLKEFGKRAPAPLLVHTSFNLFGEPLVITPRDAVRSFFCSGINALLMEGFLVDKSPGVPYSWAHIRPRDYRLGDAGYQNYSLRKLQAGLEPTRAPRATRDPFAACLPIPEMLIQVRDLGAG
jgi:hypothetical protein